MAFLTINGRDYDVLQSGATEEAPLEIGERARAFDGTPRSSVVAEKRRARFSIGPITEGQLQLLRADVALGTLVPVTGVAFNMTVFNAWVTVQSAGYIADGGTGVQRTADVSIEEA